MEMTNSKMGCNDEKHEQDHRFKQQKSVSDDLKMQHSVIDDEQSSPLLEEEEEKDGQQQQLLAKEEDIIPTYRGNDSGAGRFSENLLPGKRPVHINQTPTKITVDGGAALHMMGSSGALVSLGVRIRHSTEGFDVCQVNDESLIKDRLRVGDTIIKAGGLGMADMKIEDVQKLFMRNKSIETTIKCMQLGENCVDGKSSFQPSTLYSCILSVQGDGVDVIDGNVESSGSGLLLPGETQFDMCLFRIDCGSQAFLRFKNEAVEAGNFHPTSLEIHKYIYGNKQVWMIKSGNKFIAAIDSSNIKLIEVQDTTDGGPLSTISCGGRAFNYSKYPGSSDSIALESLEYPKHYLAIDGNEVKLKNFNNLQIDDEYLKCKLEVIEIHSTQI